MRFSFEKIFGSLRRVTRDSDRSDGVANHPQSGASINNRTSTRRSLWKRVTTLKFKRTSTPDTEEYIYFPKINNAAPFIGCGALQISEFGYIDAAVSSVAPKSTSIESFKNIPVGTTLRSGIASSPSASDALMPLNITKSTTNSTAASSHVRTVSGSSTSTNQSVASTSTTWSTKSSKSLRGAERGIFFASGNRDDDRFNHRRQRKVTPFNFLAAIPSDDEVSSSESIVIPSEENTIIHTVPQSIVDLNSIHTSISLDSIHPLISESVSFELEEVTALQPFLISSLPHLRDDGLISSHNEASTINSMTASEQPIKLEEFSDIDLSEILSADSSFTTQDLPDLGCDGVLSSSSRMDNNWERHLRVDGFSYNVSWTELEQSKTDKQMLQEALSSISFEPIADQEALESNIQDSDADHDNTAPRTFTFGDAIDGYTYCPEQRQYIPTESVDAVEDATHIVNKIKTVVDSQANTATSIPEDSTPFVIVESLPVPNGYGLDYVLGNDGDMYWHDASKGEFLKMTSEDFHMCFARHYPDPAALIFEAFGGFEPLED